jgi:hypothetical protein
VEGGLVGCGMWDVGGGILELGVASKSPPSESYFLPLTSYLLPPTSYLLPELHRHVLQPPRLEAKHTVRPLC